MRGCIIRWVRGQGLTLSADELDLIEEVVRRLGAKYPGVMVTGGERRDCLKRP